MVANADHDALAQLEFDLLRPAARARHELVMARHALIAVVFALLYNNVIEVSFLSLAELRLRKALLSEGLHDTASSGYEIRSGRGDEIYSVGVGG
jgi:hypothetical protein